MYFERLQRLNAWGLNEVVIRQLDSWLASRRPAVRKYLNPLQFSLDCQVDEGLSLDAFEWSCVQDINVLHRRFVVFCPNGNCNTYVGSYEIEQSLRQNVECLECSFEYQPCKFPESVVVYYELLTKPNGTVVWQDGEPGNVSGLRVHDIQILDTHSQSARRLLYSILGQEGVS